MEPFEHWVDIDLDPELAKLCGIFAVVGAIYFAFLYWRMKRNPPSESTGDRR